MLLQSWAPAFAGVTALGGVAHVVDSDGNDELRRWVGIRNKAHGYGGVFNRETTDKAVVELDTCREWCRSIAAEFSLTVDEPRHNPSDPPDCFVTIEGRRFGVELVELIESEHKQRAAKNETPYAGRLSEEMQWSKERFIPKLNDVLNRKGEKYRQRGQCIDVLIIHTAETYLYSNLARQWLADVQIERHPNIESAFLLFEYEPGRKVQHWPIFWLYGDLGGARIRSVPLNPDSAP